MIWIASFFLFFWWGELKWRGLRWAPFNVYFQVCSFLGCEFLTDLCRVHLKASSWRLFASFTSTIVRLFEVVSLTDWILFQVRDWPREAWGAEWSGSADPADSGTGEMAERDDGAEIQAVHGRWWGGNVQIQDALQQFCPLERLKTKQKKQKRLCSCDKRCSYCQIWVKAAGLKLKCSDLISQTTPSRCSSVQAGILKPHLLTGNVLG